MIERGHHDMGGMPAGKVERDEHDYAEWERRVDALMVLLSGIRGGPKRMTVDELRKLPVIMLTTTDDPREIARCHELGCNNYIVKPVDYEKFSEAIKQLGLFVSLVQVPRINGPTSG